MNGQLGVNVSLVHFLLSLISILYTSSRVTSFLWVKRSRCEHDHDDKSEGQAALRLASASITTSRLAIIPFHVISADFVPELLAAEFDCADLATAVNFRTRRRRVCLKNRRLGGSPMTEVAVLRR